MKRVTMELGGHSPVIVFDDVDPEKTADAAAAGKYRNAGQVCISPTRFYVQENSYNKFAARFTEKAKGLKLGDGLDKDTRMGPLANARRLDAMANIVADCQSRGGKLAAGGKRHGNQGYFFEPTVVTDLPDDSKLMTQEPFGPMAPIIPFKTFDEVVARANSLPFGLAAYAFTNNAKPRPRSATRSKPAWWASTPSTSRWPRRRSAASRKAATATRARSRALRPTR